MDSPCDSLQIIGNKVESARQANQVSQAVCILAVSKRQPIQAIANMVKCEHYDFGENYVSEMLGKSEALAHLSINWHYIGPIQSNKTKTIADIASWVHSLDRIKIAKRLNQQRAKQSTPLQVCLQVNISQEPTKSGVLLSELDALVEAILPLSHLRLRGIMVIPKKTSDVDAQRAAFAEAKKCFERINQRYFEAPLAPYSAMDTLSMGMSGDMESAIAEGSTMVRIGTALFGKRQSIGLK